MKVLTGIIPQQEPAASHHHLSLHNHHLNHPLSMMINDTGLHPSATSPAVGSAAIGGGHNINSIMTPPDAHLNSSSASYSHNNNNTSSPDDNKYSLVSTWVMN